MQCDIMCMSMGGLPTLEESGHVLPSLWVYCYRFANAIRNKHHMARSTLQEDGNIFASVLTSVMTVLMCWP